MNQTKFIEELKKINITLTEFQLNQLEEYYNLIVEYNKVMNLTGITDKEQVYLKHFYDSLTINKVVDLNKEYTLCDIGSGAGFPGIVLKIAFPNLTITLMDSLGKRVDFLNIVIEKLGLKNIIALKERAEDVARDNIEIYDIVTSRAVAHLAVLAEYSIPMVKVGGCFIAMKANMDTELLESEKAIKTLNSKITKIEEFLLPVEESKRTLIKIEKEEKTDIKYPRMNSEIKKKHL